MNFRRGRKPWRERLIALLAASIGVLRGQPELARTALVTRPNGVNSLRLWEALAASAEDLVSDPWKPGSHGASMS